MYDELVYVSSVQSLQCALPASVRCRPISASPGQMAQGRFCCLVQCCKVTHRSTCPFKSGSQQKSVCFQGHDIHLPGRYCTMSQSSIIRHHCLLPVMMWFCTCVVASGVVSESLLVSACHMGGASSSSAPSQLASHHKADSHARLPSHH